jgi:succinoglycan biosynthesis protein ExoM
MSNLPHISVCICTYRRPELLQRLLNGLNTQETEALFTYSVVVVDNDSQRSAEPVVLEFAQGSAISIKYCVQPQQNISLTRNMAVANADGDFISFIDDDEFPTQAWLLTLFKACGRYQADGVLGPVKPHFDQQPPNWVVKGKFYDRPSYPTGLVIDGRKGRTGNCLLKRELFAGSELPFRPEFRVGEDQDFFTRMIQKGHVFIWCHEALAYEVVPPIRWNRKFLLKRALLRGANSLLQKNAGGLNLVKSFIAIPLYTLVLPFALLFGYDRFMIFLVSLCDHLGKVMAALGMNPVSAQYVTE